METTLQFNDLAHDFGTFHGFNFREDRAIQRRLTAGEVVDWKCGANGEAEFWPSGDHQGVALIFRGRMSVTASALTSLDGLLSDMGSAEEDCFLRIAYACSVLGLDLEELTSNEVEFQAVKIFKGSNFPDVRKVAAFELFETYFPEKHEIWKSDPYGVLTFDGERFLNGCLWNTLEVNWGERKVLLVGP